MLVDVYINTIMYRGKEIKEVFWIGKSEDNYVRFTLWQNIVPPSPPPKPNPREES